MTSHVGSAKPVVRRRLRRARDRRDDQQAAAVSARLAGHAPDLLALTPAAGRLVLTGYLSLRGEPGTADLRARLRALGHTVLLPVLLDDLDLDWVLDAGPADGGPVGDPLRPAGPRLGPDAVTGADVVLVPALAVDASGTRLGQGGGSYDRVLARLRRAGAGAAVVAVVHADEVLPAGALPREPHDVAVDGVLTEDGVRLLGRG